MEKELVSKVWRIAGLFGKVTAGVMVWKGENIAYVTDEGVQFNVPLSAITDIKWPFLRMGMGFDAVVNGEKYKFSFAKPNASAPEIEFKKGKEFPEVQYAGFYVDDVSSLMDIKKDKATTKCWKEILQAKN